jgi:hypothetical protein
MIFVAGYCLSQSRHVVSTEGIFGSHLWILIFTWLTSKIHSCGFYSKFILRIAIPGYEFILKKNGIGIGFVYLNPADAKKKME